MLLTTLALAAALQGTQDRDFRWSGRIAEGKTLEIMGVNGSVRADAAGGSTAEVTASKSGRGNHEAVQIKVEETSDGVTICAIYPNQVGDSCHSRESPTPSITTSAMKMPSGSKNRFMNPLTP